MPRGSTIVLTGLTDEAFFIPCRKKLRAKDGTQRLKIVSVDELRMEREDSRGKWTTVLDTADFSTLILDDGSFEDALIRGVCYSADNPRTIDEYGAANQDGSDSLFAGVPPRAGQLVEITAPTIVTALSFHLGKTGSPTGSLTAEIYASDGSVPTGPVLASGTIDVSTLGVSLAMTEISLSTQVTLSAGWYGLSAHYAGGNVSNRVSIGRDNSSPSHAGHAIAQSAAGVWSANAAVDRPFVLKGARFPAPSGRYRFVAECTLEDLVTGAETEDVFRVPARVVASALNPVA